MHIIQIHSKEAEIVHLQKLQTHYAPLLGIRSYYSTTGSRPNFALPAHSTSFF